MTTWEEKPDQRTEGMKKPHFNMFQTPSGHTLVFDDTEGQESLTIGHRSGTTIQMQSDGAIVFHVAGEKQEVVFGDNKMLVTGSQDATVNGDQGLKVQGASNITVSGKKSEIVEGDSEFVTGGNSTITHKGDHESIVGGNQSTKVAGNSEFQAKKLFLGSSGNMGIWAGSQVLVTGSNIVVTGDTQIDGDVDISGDTTVGGDVDVAGDVNAVNVIASGELRGDINLL